MSKLESNIQLPTVIFGALTALIIERTVQLALIVPAQDYTQKLAEQYQYSAEKKVPWFVENLVLNGLLPQLILLAATIIFAVLFYLFVVRDKRIRLWKRSDAKKAVAADAKQESKTVAKKPATKKAPAKKPAAKKTTKK